MDDLSFLRCFKLKFRENRIILHLQISIAMFLILNKEKER